MAPDLKGGVPLLALVNMGGGVVRGKMLLNNYDNCIWKRRGRWERSVYSFCIRPPTCTLPLRLFGTLRCAFYIVLGHRIGYLQ